MGAAVARIGWPCLIQGGMGAGVSDWRLARTVAAAGQLGVVAGTALDVILTRRLQIGDPGGHMRRALGALPLPDIARRIVDKYFVRGGKPEDEPFRSPGPLRVKLGRLREELILAANFVEVFLAKEGHGGRVGINYLSKIQVPNLPSIFGAMLAGVDYVLMGAGLPKEIPGILDRLAAGEAVESELQLAQTSPGSGPPPRLSFDPREYLDAQAAQLARPTFLGIVSSVTAAKLLTRTPGESADGLVIEGPTAGGHNAPPRRSRRAAGAQELFSERDVPDLEAIRRLGVPFWLAGGWAGEGALGRAQAQGAEGIQVGTLFAFCRESGITRALRLQAIEQLQRGDDAVLTDLRASPTGFPFKVLPLAGSLSEPGAAEARRQVCDLGYLRSAFGKDGAAVGWRCPAESSKSFLAKGGQEAELKGRKCVCNALLANIGLAQVTRGGGHELPLLTAGSDMAAVLGLVERHGVDYGALDVLEHLLGATPQA